ncbi:MAG: crotonase [Desulfobacteraceae bacterium 4484_190.1]|nr:MAG: crotonase [Desulfobacteraceae bacterium 4484_190.1]
MDFKNLLFDIEDGVATVTFNRPKALNALNTETFHEVGQVIDHIKENDEISAVLFTGAGDKAFVAGADLAEISRKESITDVMEFIELGHDTFRAIELMRKPVIAAVNGLALGGGTELAVSCDMRFASENAMFGTPEINLGLIPGWGGTQRVARLVGVGLAKEIVMSGEPVTAKRAYEIGLINRLVAPEDLLPKAKEYAKKLAAKPGFAMKMAKYAINFGYDLPLDNARMLEIQCASQCFSTEDLKEGVSAFLEKRKPKFKGR